jgi:hypothetical protein
MGVELRKKKKVHFFNFFCLFKILLSYQFCWMAFWKVGAELRIREWE